MRGRRRLAETATLAFLPLTVVQDHAKGTRTKNEMLASEDPHAHPARYSMLRSNQLTARPATRPQTRRTAEGTNRIHHPHRQALPSGELSVSGAEQISDQSA